MQAFSIKANVVIVGLRPFKTLLQKLHTVDKLRIVEILCHIKQPLLRGCSPSLLGYQLRR